VREQVAMALYNKGIALGQLDRPEEAEAAFDEVIGRYRDDPTLSVRDVVAHAVDVLRVGDDGAD
jgi:hypothetical protein